MKRFAVIGFPVAHSRSPEMFHAWWGEAGLGQHFQYEKVAIAPEDLKAFLQGQGQDYIGLNVTAPLKTLALEHCKVLTEAAEAIGAVNCLAFLNGQWHGHNTDADGFWDAIQPLVPRTGHAVILGNGGSARAVHYALHSRGWRITTLARHKKPDFPGEQLPFNTAVEESVDLVVQCTPVGMAPNTESHPPLPLLASWHDVTVIDLIYQPEDTHFMKLCRDLSAQTMNGARMLETQGKKAWDYWRSLQDLPHI